MREKAVFVSSYGNKIQENRGIVRLLYHENNTIETQLYPIDGKVNCCIEHGKYVYVPVKEVDANYIYIYRKKQDMYEMMNKIETTYFYSYGCTSDDQHLYLASYEHGANAMLDVTSGKETLHELKEDGKQGKSHYIGYTPDKEYLFAIDNGLQNIILYDDKLHQKKVLHFDDENIRLASYSNYSEHIYVNTEKSNVIYALAYRDVCFSVDYKIAMLDGIKGCYSGGNAISADGKFLCITIRGINEIQCFAIAKDGSLTLYDKITCGDMPRDACFMDDLLCVSCTDSHVVEFYIIKEKLIKVNEVHVASPITFSLT